MDFKSFILLILILISCSEGNAQEANSFGTDEKGDDQNPYYFFSEFKRKQATFIGECGKGIQIFNNLHALKQIKNPKIRKILKTHLKKNIELTAMSFNYDNSKHYMNVVDMEFVSKNCQKNIPQKVFLDGYLIQKQSKFFYSQTYLITKIIID